MLLQHFQVIFRKVAASLLVSIRRPVEVGEIDAKLAVFFGSGVENLDSGINHFWADSVCADLGNFVRLLALG